MDSMDNDKVRKNPIMQDVVPPKKSIRNVELSSRRSVRDISINKIIDTQKQPQEAPPIREAIPEAQTYIPKAETTDESSRFSYTYDYTDPKKVRSKKFLIYISIAIFVLVCAFGISALFKSAQITVTPKNNTYALNADFTAIQDDTSGNLPFQLVSITKDEERSVPATGQKEVDTKASGKIIIFNNYSSASQKLVATTRFETPEGLIFRLPTAVTVPGVQTKNGISTPGSVQVTVVADAVGNTYNIGLEDFTLPGLKGDARYTKIYARSATVMSGGFSGIQKVVDLNTASTTEAELQSDLTNLLQKEVALQIPANFVLYPNDMSYSFSPVVQIATTTTDGTALLRKTGTVYALIFNRGLLSQHIVSIVLASTTGMIKIPNLDSLTFSYKNGQVYDPTGNDTTIHFTLSGNPQFVWVFDENKLKSDLLGLSKKQAETVIAQYTSISEVWLKTSPFWNNTIPSDPKKVTLVNTLSQ